MQVKFANAEVEIWKLRQGVVVARGDEYFHIQGIMTYKHHCSLIVQSFNGGLVTYDAPLLEWLEPF